MPETNSRRLLKICALALMLAPWSKAESPVPAAAKPLTLNPDNPHYFTFGGKPTILVSSGEHYGAVLNLDFDYAPYLEELHATGLNQTRLFVGTYHEVPGSFGIVDNTLAPKSDRFICPWPRTSTPGAADGGNKFDVTRFDPAYFARLKDFTARASKLGVVIEVNLFSPNYDDSMWKVSPMRAGNNINSVGDCPRTDVYTLKHADLLKVQQAVVTKIVQSLGEFDNVYFEVCNEPYFGGITMEWQDAIVKTIVEAEKDRPAKHLISMNIANGSTKIDRPNPDVSIFNFHYCSPPDAVAQNAGLNKVIGNNETGFKGSKDVTYRGEGWDFILAGGALFSNLDYSFTVGHPDGSLVDYKAPGGGSHALREQLGYLAQFMEKFDFVHMKPDNAVIKSAEKGVTARALVQSGKQYAVYIKGGKQINLQLDLPAGTYAVEWLHPIGGKTESGESVTSKGGVVTLHSPEYTEDIALRLVAK